MTDGETSTAARHDLVAGWAWYPASGVLHWSGAVAEVWAGSTPPATFEQLLDRCAEADRARVDLQLDRAAYAGVPVSVRCLVRLPQGTRRFELRGAGVPEDGARALVVGTAVDVTDAQAERRRLEEASARAVVDAAPDALLVVDASGRIVQAGRRAVELFGYPDSLLIGMTIEALVPEQLRDRHVKHRAEYLHDPQTRPMGVASDLLARRADGTEFAAEISLSPIAGSSDSLVVAAVRDVTEHRRMARAAERSLESQQLTGQALRINDTVVQRLSVAAYALERGDTRAALRSIDETLTAARSLMANLVEAGAELLPGPDQQPLAALSPAPARSPVEAGPIRAVIADDTRDVRLAMRALLETVSDIDVVGEAENGRQAIDIVDDLQPDLVLLDLSMPVLDGMAALERIHASHPHIKVVVLSGYGREQAGNQALAAGAAAYVEKGGATRRLINLLTDLFPDRIGPARQAAPAGPPLEADHQGEPIEPDALAAAVHALRAPLEVLANTAETLLDKRDRMPSSVVGELLGSLVRNTRAMDRVVDDLADSYRSGPEGFELTSQPVSLAELVTATVADLKDVTGTHVVSVLVEDVSDDCVVAADPYRLRQVIENLLTNAAKFSPPGSPIEVTLANDGIVAELAVIDRGPGIPAHRITELFRKFSRLGRPEAGMGLGLYLSHQIARALGGDLVLADTSSEGSTFVLMLPLLAPRTG